MSASAGTILVLPEQERTDVRFYPAILAAALLGGLLFAARALSRAKLLSYSETGDPSPGELTVGAQSPSGNSNDRQAGASIAQSRLAGKLSAPWPHMRIKADNRPRSPIRSDCRKKVTQLNEESPSVG